MSSVGASSVVGTAPTLQEGTSGRRVAFDPPPTWDGKDPAKRWTRYKTELELWHLDTDLETKKHGTRLYRIGLEEDAKDLIEGHFKPSEIAATDGYDKIVAFFDNQYKGFLELTKDEEFDKALFGERKDGEKFIGRSW